MGYRKASGYAKKKCLSLFQFYIDVRTINHFSCVLPIIEKCIYGYIFIFNILVHMCLRVCVCMFAHILCMYVCMLAYVNVHMLACDLIVSLANLSVNLVSERTLSLCFFAFFLE